MQIVHRDYSFDTANRYDNYDYIFRDDLQCTNLPYQPITIHPTVNGIGVDFNQVVAVRIMFSEEEETESFENLQDQFETIHLGKTYRNTHNIVSQLMTLSKYKKGRGYQLNCSKFVKHFLHTPSHGHFIHGPQLHVGIYHAGYQKKIKLDLEQFVRKKLVPRIFSSDEKKILLYGSYFPSEHLIKGCVKDYPSGLFSSVYPGSFYNIHSTEFTECHIVWDFAGESNEQVPLETISDILSELLKSKTLLEEVSVAYQKTNLPIPDETRSNLSESQKDLNDAISKLEQHRVLFLTYETSIEEISEVMNQIESNLNLLQGPYLESRLLLSYQLMSEKFGKLSERFSELNRSTLKKRVAKSSAQVQLMEKTTRINFFRQYFRLQEVHWNIGKFQANLDEILSMTSTSDLCPEEAEERATLLETRTMTMKVSSMLDALASDMGPFSFPKIIQTLQLTNNYFVSFFEKCEDNGREDHENETEKLRTTRDLLNKNVSYLRLLNHIIDDYSGINHSYDDHALQFFLDAISRTRVLCRVHMLFYNTIGKTPNKSYLRELFPDARIKYVNMDEINW